MFYSKTQLFPSLHYWQLAMMQGIWVLEAHENYQKRGYCNRFTVLQSQGTLNLSIPLVKGKNERQAIKDVKIAYDESWLPQHLRSIRSVYGAAPFFHHYYDYIEALFLSKPAYLWDLNMEAIKTINALLSLDIQIKETEQFSKEVSGIDWRFKQDNPPAPLEYLQLFEEKAGHFDNPSVLDILFCLGPESYSLFANQT